MNWQLIGWLVFVVLALAAYAAFSDLRYEYREMEDCPQSWRDFAELRRKEPEREWCVYHRDYDSKIVLIRGRRAK